MNPVFNCSVINQSHSYKEHVLNNEQTCQSKLIQQGLQNNTFKAVSHTVSVTVSSIKGRIFIMYNNDNL